MAVGKQNGSYWIYSSESETFKQIRSQVKLTLVENSLEETHLDRKHSVCVDVDMFGCSTNI